MQVPHTQTFLSRKHFFCEPCRIKKSIVPCVALLYSWKDRSRSRAIVTTFILLLIFSASQGQTNDTSYKLSDLDTLNTSLPANDFKEDYATDEDSSENNFYDSSAYYFNWKLFTDQPYTNEKITPNTTQKKYVDSLRTTEDFWYVNAIEHFRNNEARLLQDPKYRDSLVKAGVPVNDEQNVEQTTTSIFFGEGITVVIWSLIIGVFVFAVIYFLMANRIGFFARSNASLENVSEESDISTNIFHLPYEDLLQKAYNEKNYRLAVRILYLQTLKMMSEKAVISFQPEYTNMHYLQQIQRTAYYPLFYSVTRDYEYVWYGKFDLQETKFNQVRQDFEALHNKLLA